MLVLGGGYTEEDDGALEFHADPGPSAAAREALEDEVETRLSGGLGPRGYLDEAPPARPDDGWWLSAAREPSGGSGDGPRKLRGRFEVNSSVRVRADDRAARAQLIRYVARPPFAEAHLEVIDDDQVRFTFPSPSRSGQRELVLHPLALLRRLAWLVPPPRQHQLRAFGVLAPSARLRPKVVPVGRVAVEGSWFGAQKFEPAEGVPYREAWAKLRARVYERLPAAVPGIDTARPGGGHDGASRRPSPATAATAPAPPPPTAPSPPSARRASSATDLTCNTPAAVTAPPIASGSEDRGLTRRLHSPRS